MTINARLKLLRKRNDMTLEEVDCFNLKEIVSQNMTRNMTRYDTKYDTEKRSAFLRLALF